MNYFNITGWCGGKKSRACLQWGAGRGAGGLHCPHRKRDWERKMAAEASSALGKNGIFTPNNRWRDCLLYF